MVEEGVPLCRAKSTSTISLLKRRWPACLRNVCMILDIADHLSGDIPVGHIAKKVMAQVKSKTRGLGRKCLHRGMLVLTLQSFCPGVYSYPGACYSPVEKIAEIPGIGP